jgi:hypothetical protein
MLHNAMPINTALLETSDAKQEDGSIITEEVGKYSGIIYEMLPSRKSPPPPPNLLSPTFLPKKQSGPLFRTAF